jgi:hypothetical protein
LLSFSTLRALAIHHRPLIRLLLRRDWDLRVRRLVKNKKQIRT